MRILQISDLHGHTPFIETMQKEAAEADLIILSGDITNFSGGAKAEEVVSAVRRYQSNILAIPGNCDRNSVGTYLRQAGVSVDRERKFHDGYSICGMGGSIPCPGRTPNEYTEADFETELSAIGQDEHDNAIYVIHQPPVNTMLDRIGSGSHVGSHAVRNFLENSSAILCLTGHIHESRGVDTLGSTTVVNPGPARHGNYAIIDVKDGEVKVELAIQDG